MESDAAEVRGVETDEREGSLKGHQMDELTELTRLQRADRRLPAPVYKVVDEVKIDINAAILAVSRLRKRKVATPTAILAALMELIGSDALTREVRGAMKETWE